ncbi:MAG: glycosyltransferase family 2 protein [Candidatus Omnitrophica bacterium]|nr:glycosyltransferase family 2 protein [Candidatus Omnitrophota bacterium]
MKVIVQIPCLNEAKTLPITLKDIPRKIENVSKVEVLVIDDGSTDRTSEVAKEHGVEHIVRFRGRKGLARAFEAGVEAALSLGADILVNTDGDNQYRGEDIKKLVKPIIDGEADIVVGSRDIDHIRHFSVFKKILQKMGSWVVRRVSGTNIPDASTGFRAYSRKALLEINIVSEFSYTLETIIEAGKKNLAISNVSVRTNPPLRKSRLYKSIFQYITKSANTILRIYTMYEALYVFMMIGLVVFFCGTVLFLRYLYFYIFNLNPTGHIQSLILGAVLSLIGLQVMVFGLVADLVSSNRKLIEKILIKIKRKS